MDSSKNQNLSLKRFRAILWFLAGAPAGKGFEELRRDIGNPVPTTLSRLLKALRAEGWVAQDPGSGRYKVGDDLQALAQRCLLQGRLALIAEACRNLSEATGQSALYCELDDAASGTPMLVRRVAQERPGGLHYAPMNVPDFLLVMGFGLPLLTALDNSRQEKILAEHRTRSGEKPAVVQDWLKQLEERGVICLPEVLNHHPLGCTRIVSAVRTQPAGALGITIFGRIDTGLAAEYLESLAQHVRAAAIYLEQQLTDIQE